MCDCYEGPFRNMFAFGQSGAFAETWRQMIQGTGRWLSAPPAPRLIIAVLRIGSLLTFTKPAWLSTARTMSQGSQSQTLHPCHRRDTLGRVTASLGAAIFMSGCRSKCLSLSRLFWGSADIKYEGWSPSECCIYAAWFPVLRLSLWGRWQFFLFFFLFFLLTSQLQFSLPSLIPAPHSVPTPKSTVSVQERAVSSMSIIKTWRVKLW